MKRTLLVVTATLALSACAEDLGYGPSFSSGLVYYDSYYGPFYNGYWGPGGTFYYSTARGHPYQRDEGHHFHRENPGGGFHGERTHPAWIGRHGPGTGQPHPSGPPHQGDQGHRDHH